MLSMQPTKDGFSELVVEIDQLVSLVSVGDGLW